MAKAKRKGICLETKQNVLLCFQWFLSSITFHHQALIYSLLSCLWWVFLWYIYIFLYYLILLFFIIPLYSINDKFYQRVMKWLIKKCWCRYSSCGMSSWKLRFTWQGSSKIPQLCNPYQTFMWTWYSKCKELTNHCNNT